MAASLWQEIEKVLPYVEKPSRYINREWNSHHKPHRKSMVKIALAYPDTYEVGLSNLGLQILYEILNKRDDTVAERVYAPWLDMEAQMRKRKIPLFSLESHFPVSYFDILGFSLQTEMTYTNVLNMLDLARIPVWACERDESYPLVVGGGPCVFNPEPVASFFDLFVIGEAEEVILEVVEEYKKCCTPHATRHTPHGARRTELLKRLAKIDGVYVPKFYKPRYDEKGKIVSVKPISDEVSQTVVKRAVKNLNEFMFPEKPVVPFTDVVHNRCSLEIMRGCTRGCRFCQAGVIYRPARERDSSLIKEHVERLVRETGYEEVSLSSLSSTDYSWIESLVASLADDCKGQGVSISLPSLRADTFSVSLASRIRQVRKTGLTFAPEAGSQRLRDVINKCATEKEILDTVKCAYDAGWRKIKLYFMIGLPTETKDDLESMVRLVRKAVQVGLDVAPRSEHRQVDIVCAISCFVPKAHTSFQWVAQDGLEEIEEKQKYLKRSLRIRHVTLKWHDGKQSAVEGLLARGDRRVSKVIDKVWRKGARFDAWTEVFNFDLWREAVKDVGSSLDFYVLRERTEGEILPWEHIEPGVSREFLWSEYERGLEGGATWDCRLRACTECGVCDALGFEKLRSKMANVR